MGIRRPGREFLRKPASTGSISKRSGTVMVSPTGRTEGHPRCLLCRDEEFVVQASACRPGAAARWGQCGWRLSEGCANGDRLKPARPTGIALALDPGLHGQPPGNSP